MFELERNDSSFIDQAESIRVDPALNDMRARRTALFAQNPVTNKLERVAKSGDSIMTAVGPNTLGLRLDYDATGNILYIGQNYQGAITSDLTWTIKHLVYDANANLITRQSAVGAWDNRLSLTYT